MAIIGRYHGGYLVHFECFVAVALRDALEEVIDPAVKLALDFFTAGAARPPVVSIGITSSPPPPPPPVM